MVISDCSPRHGLAIPLRKSGSIYYFTRFLLLFLEIQLAFQAHFLMANPVGGSVVAGSANIVNTDTTTTITTSDRAVINWAGFSIKAGETTQFIQPSSSSAVLNRVTSGDPSRLMGNLQANGQVYLLNPNGVLIGNGAVVNVGSFLASTANIADGDFMSGGNMNFVGATDASIVNQGSIFSSSGDVFLLARTIQNAESGTISAPNGTVGLAAGNQFYLQKDQIGAMRVEVKADAVPGSKSAIGLNNAGLLEAMRVQMSADGSLYGLAINQQGMVRATGVRQGADGTISLIASGGAILQSGNLSAANVDGTGGKISISGQDIVSTFSSVITAAGAVDGGSIEVAASGISVVSGRLSVEGATGKAGRIQLTGEGVALIDAKVSANGATAGGEVLVGGDYQGLNPLVKNASRTYASKSSEISADSVIAGNGGKVILWANGETEFHGNISAKGGSVSGDGGFVEISGKAYLDTSGAIVDTSAINGRAGTFLLDPFNVYITQDESDAGKVLSWLQGQAVDYLVQAVDDALKLDDILVDAWDIFNLAEDLINYFTTEPPGFNDYIGNPYYVQASTIQDWLGKNEVNVYADQDIIIQTDLTTTSSQNNPLNLYAGRSIVIGPINSPYGDPDGSTSTPVQINLSGDFYAYPNWQGNVPTIPVPPAPANLQNTEYRGPQGWEKPVPNVLGGPGNFILGVGSSISVNGNFSIDIAPTGTTVQYVQGVIQPAYSTTAYIQGQTYLGGTITTTGTQLYSGPVTLMGDTTLISQQEIGFGTQSYYTSSFNYNYINSYNVPDSTSGGPFSLTIGSSSQPTSVQFGKTSSGSLYPFQGIGFTSTESINPNANYPTTVFPYIQCGALQSLTVYGATTIDMSGASITTVGAQTYNGVVTLTTDTVLSSTSGSITFANTLNGTAAGVQALGLTAGTGGNVVFTGAVGGTTPLGAVTVTSAGTVLATSTFNAASYTQLAGTVSTTFNGLVNLTTNFDFTGQALNINGVGANVVGNLMDVTNAGLFTTAVGANLTVGNEFVQNGAGLNTLGGNIDSTNDGISFATGMTLTDDILMSTGLFAGDDIVFSAGITDGAGAFDLGLTAGTGGAITGISVAINNLTLTSAASAVFTGAVTVNDLITTANNLTVSLTGSGNTFTQNVDFLNTGAVTLGDNSADTFLFNGGLNFTGNAPVNLAVAISSSGDVINFGTGGVTLTANSTVDTTNAGGVAAGAAITFGSTLDGTQTLGLTAGAGGAITLTGAVGGTTPLGAITISSANDVTAAAITASSLAQLTGQGTTTFNGAQSYSAVAGLNVVTDTISLQNTVTTNTGGIVTLNADGFGLDAGTLTIAAAGDITSEGAVNLTGVQGISTAGDVTTSGDVVNYVSATTLTGGILVLTTNGGTTGGTITFGDTLDGAQSLGLTAGTTGDVVFTGAVGGTTPLGAITISSANDVTAAAITASSLAQLTGQGTTTFNGAQSYSAVAGLNVVTDTISLQNTVTTNTGGIVTLNADGFGLDAGTLTIAAAGDITSAGNVTLIGNQGITMGAAGNGPAIHVGTVGVPANLIMGDGSMTGDINQVAGSVVSTGTTSINTAGNVLLFQDLNDFQDTVTVVEAGGISLYDSNVLSLASAKTTGGQVFQANDRITTTGAGAFAAAGANGILMCSENSGVTINAGSSFSSSLTQMVNANGAAFVNNGVSSSAFTGSVVQIFSTSRFLNTPDSFNGGLAGFAPNFLIVPTVQSVGETVATAGNFNVTYTTTGDALPNRAFTFRTAFIDNLTAAEYFTITSTMANMTSIPVPNYQMYLPSISSVSFRAAVSPRPNGKEIIPGAVRLWIQEPSNVRSKDDTKSAIKSSTTSAFIQAQEIEL